ncbi:LPD29 domain-containing protein [Streptomyces sp. DSM 42041]|uniref:LPD29 domain-containing protein n=1 Tax=Streptomyces hazeniae TaxID=3075538 RepID=A0ABU2NJV4_9ACTN|nr:LPD29 domain-containing protein [Streptomyces sp. DSM 42041]MDT0377270.1 LPD29 domain-containing protein [Streptomyces sp. DSM 42041]
MQPIPTKQVAAHLRALLKKAFPTTKFSVTCPKGTGAWIDVRWTDGPHERDVRRITAPAQDANWDDAYDTSSTLTVTVDGHEVTGRPVLDGISHNRAISPAVKREAAALWSAAHDGADPARCSMTGPFRCNGQHIDAGWPRNQVEQIATRVLLAHT